MMDFSEPHFDTGMGMLVNVKSNISSLDDIKYIAPSLVNHDLEKTIETSTESDSTFKETD